MIRLIQRRLIIPRGDTGTFSIPVLAGKDTGDASILTIFDPLTHRKLREKRMELSDGVLTVNFTHGDTVNLPVGQYVWDIKFYSNPVFADDQIIDGEEVDSYYAAFTLPVCEIRETGDNLLMDDDAPQAKLAPGQIDLITAAITEIQAAKEAAASSAAEADTSATNAESSASAAAMSASAALDSQTAATASQQGAAVSESHAAASASSAATSATTAGESADSAVSSATSAAQSALAAQDAQTAAESASSNATAQATNALASAQAAANSANSATNSQKAAANSATAASQSAGAAQVSETNASMSAAQAGHSATTAQEAAAQAIATAVAIHEEIPTQVSQLENDAGYLTEHQDISGKANSADLATVATSGSYNDLSNKPFIPSAISDLTDDSGHYTKPANGIPATDMTSGVQTSLGLADTAYQKPANGIPANDLASGVIPSVPVQDVQIKNTSILNNGVANIPLAANGAVGLVQGNNTYGTAITAAGDIMIYRADDSAIKNGNGEYKPIVPYTEHQAVFYGLAKAAGDTTQRESQNNVGIYTSGAQSAIQAMLDVPSTSSVASSIASAVGNVHSFDVEVVQSLPTQNIKEHTIYFVSKTGDTNDVYDEYIYVNNGWEMIGNTQIDLSNYVQKTDYADGNTYGLVKIGAGLAVGSNGKLQTGNAGDAAVKAGIDSNLVISPGRQHMATFYGLSKVAGVDLANETVTLGTYPETSKTAIRSLIGAAAASDVTVTNVQINGGSILNNGIANIPIASSNNLGVVKVNESYGIVINPFTGELTTYGATSNQIKSGNEVYRPLSVIRQHEAAFYGLAKAAGADEKDSTLSFGTYTETAKSAIRTMIGAAATSDIPSVPVQDVQVNGTSIVSNGIASIPVRTNVAGGSPELVTSDGISAAFNVIMSTTSAQIKAGTMASRTIMPSNQHESVFYGLAKAAGDSTQSASSNAVGTYTSTAKTAIQTMLGVENGVTFVETISSTTPVIVGEPNVRYKCGEVSTISITPPAAGVIDVTFTSGSTPAVLTLPNTVVFPEWVNLTTLQANTKYEIMIVDGECGGVMTWPV